MHLDRKQWCWLLYDPGNAAFALLVRALFAPLFFKACVDGIWSESDATGYWGLISSGAGIVAGAFSLYLGALADARGRRKFFLAFFVLLGCLATAGMSFLPQSAYITVILLYFIALCAYMVGNSFYDSLLLSVAEPAQFSSLSTLAYGIGYAGGLLTFIIALGAGYFLQDSLLLARVSFLIAAVWWGVFTIPLRLQVRELPGTRQSVRWFEGFAELWKTLKEVSKYRNALIFLIAYFLYIDGVSTILLMAAPISIDIGMSQMLLMLTLLGLQIIGLPSTIVFGKLANRFGPRKMVYAALVIYIITAGLIGCLTLCSNTSSKIAYFLAAAFLIALAQGGIQALSRSLFGYLIPPEKSAEFFGVFNIFGKFTTILGPVLIYLAASWWQHTEYGIILLIVPFTAGGILLSKVKFPHKV